MNAHAQVNRLVSVLRHLPARPSVGEWHVMGGRRYECVATPDGPKWRTTLVVDFGKKKTA